VPVPTVDRVSGQTRVETAVALSAQRTSARTVIVTPSASPAESLVSAPLAGLLGAPVLLTRREGLEPSVAEEVRRLGAVNAYVVGRRDQLAEQVVTDLRAAGVQNVARLFGLDAPGLSAVVARELRSYPQINWTDRVLLALGEADDVNRTWPDALSAGALAAHRRDPILLTGSDELPPDVAEVLTELRPSLVQIVGGTAAIREAVADQVAAAAGRGVTIERLSGRTRYETSLAVAQEAVASGLDAPAVWLATGRNFPDALAAGPAAARHRAPLLLIDGEQTGGSPTVEAWLLDSQSSVRRATVVGGEAVIRGDVLTALWQ
jgi:putative cell wall-binding protein